MTGTRAMRRVSAVTCVTVVGVGVLAPAAAGWTEYPPYRIQKTSGYNAEQSKSVTVTCPAGEYVAGGGAGLSPDHGGVVLTGMLPGPDLRSVRATAHATAGHTVDWSVTVYAVCKHFSRPPARVVATGIAGAAASCPDGLRIYGFGYEFDPSAGGAYLTRIAPDEGLTEVGVGVGGPLAGQTTLTAVAICYPANPEALEPPRRVSTSGGDLSTGPVSIWLEYSTPLQIHSVGATVRSRTTAAMIDGLVPYPYGDTAEVHVTPVGAPLNAAPSAAATLADDPDDPGDVTASAPLIGTSH